MSRGVARQYAESAMIRTSPRPITEAAASSSAFFVASHASRRAIVAALAMFISVPYALAHNPKPVLYDPYAVTAA